MLDGKEGVLISWEKVGSPESYKVYRSKDNKEYEGIILDINNDGQLIIKKEEEILYINSGEIKIKR